MSSEFKPTTNVQVEPETVFVEDEPDLVPATPIKPHRQAATCCPIKQEVEVQTTATPTDNDPYNPLLLLQALGLAFSVGALIGIGFSYAFSRPTVVEYIGE